MNEASTNSAFIHAKFESETPPGTRKIIDGVERVFHYGYWIKTYEPPADSLSAKKRLIEALTRRLFNHVEHGINVPGVRLNEARKAYDTEQDFELKRVKGAMLAGALFNRATDIFTKLVDLQAVGVTIQSDNALMRECGRCLQEALELGKMVLHRSGDEGIDELWGEPFKAFSIPVEAFYESRYIKIGQAMRDIDQIADALISSLEASSLFPGIRERARLFADLAKVKCETLRTDEDIFDVWARFTVSAERMCAVPLRATGEITEQDQAALAQGIILLKRARDLIYDITRARVSMPKSTHEFSEACNSYLQLYCRKSIA